MKLSASQAFAEGTKAEQALPENSLGVWSEKYVNQRF